MNKRFLIVIIATVLALTLSNCAHAVLLPAEEAIQVEKVGQANLTELVAHYAELHAQARPPTDDEALYWENKYKEFVTMYLILKDRVREMNDLENVTKLFTLLANAVLD